MKKPICPHCKKPINTDWEYLNNALEDFNFEDSTYQMQCFHCKCWFEFEVSMVPEYKTQVEFCENCDDEAKKYIGGQWFCELHFNEYKRQL
jgi:hypothetical protein